MLYSDEGKVSHVPHRLTNRALVYSHLLLSVSAVTCFVCWITWIWRSLSLHSFMIILCSPTSLMRRPAFHSGVIPERQVATLMLLVGAHRPGTPHFKHHTKFSHMTAGSEGGKCHIHCFDDLPASICANASMWGSIPDLHSHQVPRCSQVTQKGRLS